MIPHRTPFILPIIYPSLWWRIPGDGRFLYLTFDDGPVPGPTEYVLNTLRHFNIQATFFCIGDNVRKHPEVFSRILAEGHQAGNHTFHHLNGWKHEDDQYLKNIEACRKEMFPAQEGSSLLFRPPYGKIKFSQIKALESTYSIVMWDVLSKDYDRNLSPEQCLSNTLKFLRPGSIVLFHDSLKAEKNMQYALPRLIEDALKRGYNFKVLGK
jgi:peptidoglycan/xylan/chitin deacetylase (PgdA/CDA1 family)